MVVLFYVEDATAKEISGIAAIPPTKVYSVLEKLESRGFIKHLPGKPRIFMGASPAEVFDRLIRVKEKRIGQLKYEKGVQISIIKNLLDEKERYLYPDESVELTQEYNEQLGW
jgi:sugar-specific transcriptional regulator TrmB